MRHQTLGLGLGRAVRTDEEMSFGQSGLILDLHFSREIKSEGEGVARLRGLGTLGTPSCPSSKQGEPTSPPQPTHQPSSLCSFLNFPLTPSWGWSLTRLGGAEGAVGSVRSAWHSKTGQSKQNKEQKNSNGSRKRERTAWSWEWGGLCGALWAAEAGAAGMRRSHT